jgi:signal transduction histidine kinase
VTLGEAIPYAVTVEVHNFGPAIPMAAQGAIFEAFNREASAGDHHSSVGLGLFIANQIVRAHGGSITVQSPDRHGTTFTVLLPRRPAISWSPVESPPP